MYGFVRDILLDKGNAVYTTSPEAMVRGAVRTMSEKGIGALVVVQDGGPVGLVAERDVLRLVDEGRDAGSTRIADVMARDFVTVEPGTAVDVTMALMTRSRQRHLPVLDGGTLAGLVSIGDVTRHLTLSQETEIRHLVDYIRGPQAGT